MAFSTAVTVDGDSDTYTISPAIKKYTLRDLGFEVTAKGSFVYVGALDAQSPFNAAAHLKITFNPDLSSFKMSTVNASQSAAINIFKHARADEFTTQYHFILDEMVKRGVFTRA